MRSITVRLLEAMHRALAAEAQASGRSIAAVVRSRLEASAARSSQSDPSVYARARDLAGVVAGSTASASNDRRRLRRP
jgi:hypothetical protein